MKVETHLDRGPVKGSGETSGLGKGLFYLLGYAIVFGLVLLSMWAVAQVQLESRPEGDPLRYWYLTAFLAAEAWVAVGLTIMVLRMKQRHYIAALVALVCWLPALGLSAMQESRFHLLLDSQQDATVAPELTKRVNAEARIAELTSDIAIIAKPTRSVAAIEAELARYETRANYPTKTAALRSELADAKAYAAKQTELASHRLTMEDTAALAAESQDAKKVGQTFTIPWLKWEVSASFTVWTLIAWMMAIKALGPWLLFGSSLKAVKAETVDDAASIPESAVMATPEPIQSDLTETAPTTVQEQQEALEAAAGTWREVEARDGTKRRMKVI